MSAAWPEFGCQHIQQFFEVKRKEFVSAYIKALQAINDKPEIVRRTCTAGPDGQPFVTLATTYLCLQCSNISTAEGRDAHAAQKGHMFSVSGLTSFLYCKNCDDIVFDPALEDIRMLKGKKRKSVESLSNEDSRLIFTNTTSLECDIDGIRGLYNLGQSCYINALLQCFLHNPFLRAYFLSDFHRANSCEIEHCMTCALDDIFRDFYGTKKLEGVAPLKVLEVTWRQNADLAGNRQQDAAEFMHHMKNSLCESSSIRNPEGSTPSSQGLDDKGDDPDCSCPVHRTFQGKTHSNLSCDNCRYSTRNIETFTDLSLDLQSARATRQSEAAKSRKESGEKAKKAKAEDGGDEEEPLTLHDCLMSYTALETIPDSRCEKCDSYGKTKQLSLHRLPPVLTLHLKRFEHFSATAAKIKDQVKFPMRLDLHPYSTKHPRSRSASPDGANSGREKGEKETKPDASGPEKQGPVIFELASVVVHIGSQLDQGHYIAYCRDPGNTHDNTWFKFDDEKVTVVSEKEVLGAQAYLLFYMVRELF